MRRPLLASLSLVSAFAACSAAPASSSSELGTEAPGTVADPIIRGVASDASQDAVVLLIHGDKNGFSGCTGTLLAPNLILTARHCVSTTVEASFACDSKGALLTSGDGGKVFADFTPAQIYVFPGAARPDFNNPQTRAAAVGAKIFHDDATVLCGHDVSLILLDRSLAGAAISPVRIDPAVQVGDTITAVGWGVTTTSPTPTVRQQRQGVKIVHVGPFDGDTDVPPVPANDFSVGEAICAGDSGGPAYDDQGAVVGVVSRGGNGSDANPSDPSATCTGTGAVNDYTQLAPFKDLLEQAYAAAGQDPWYEGQPDPRLAKFGEACTTGADCRSTMCAAGASGASTCTASCSADADCPSGSNTVCDTKAGFCAAATGGSSGGGCSVTPAGTAGKTSEPAGVGLLGALGVFAFARGWRGLRRRRA